MPVAVDRPVAATATKGTERRKARPCAGLFVAVLAVAIDRSPHSPHISPRAGRAWRADIRRTAHRLGSRSGERQDDDVLGIALIVCGLALISASLIQPLFRRGESPPPSDEAIKPFVPRQWVDPHLPKLFGHFVGARHERITFLHKFPKLTRRDRFSWFSTNLSAIRWERRNQCRRHFCPAGRQ